MKALQALDRQNLDPLLRNPSLHTKIFFSLLRAEYCRNLCSQQFVAVFRCEERDESSEKEKKKKKKKETCT